jgi:hypothetical protein
VVRVVHLTVPEQMDNSDLSHGHASLPAHRTRRSAK